MREEILRLERVTFQKRGVSLLDSLSLNIFAGEILGLVPANSFGVAALTQILTQNLPLHYGYIYYKERLINTWRGSDGKPNRIALIRNQSSLVDSLTVADNIFVLRPGFRKYLIEPKVLKQQLQPFLEELGADIQAEASPEQLTVFQRVVVELLKSMVAGCALTILWDVSTFLSQQELEILHGILRRCAAKGMSFLYICPHMEEAADLCDRTALMRNGQIVKIFDRGQEAPSLLPLARLNEQVPAVDHSRAPAFSAENIRLAPGSSLSFQVAPGECLVIQDLSNRFFAHPLDRIPKNGRIFVEGRPLTRKNFRDIAVIQQLAATSMLFPHLSYLDNLCFTLDHRMKDVWRSPRIRKSLRQNYGPILGDEVFDRSIEELTESQKYALVYTRVLLQRPKAVFCVQPFKGADPAQRRQIAALIRQLLDKQMGVVILDVTLADSLPLAHRVLQLQQGKQPRELKREDFLNKESTD